MVVQENDVFVRGMGMRVETVDVSDAVIYRRYSNELTRFASAVVGRDEAADVVSDVVVRVLSNGGLHRLRDPKPYLYKAVLNEARSHLRRHKLAASTNGSQLLTSRSDSTETQEVLDAVHGLPPQQRAAAFLVYWAGYSTVEAAALIGVRPGTFGRYLHLARRRLKEVLDET